MQQEEKKKEKNKGFWKGLEDWGEGRSCGFGSGIAAGGRNISRSKLGWSDAWIGGRVVDFRRICLEDLRQGVYWRGGLKLWIGRGT